ncbi:MAG TPA: S9 family peptidase, partial [Vicinamibacterales bacterium]|nr:S9 family peptidase [Vicinamibacterales bacterium]
RRALTIEDYYRVQTVGGAAISPDGRWVTFTIASRVEDTNTTETATWFVAADGTGQPWRVVHYGRDVSGGRWTDDNRLEYVAERRQWTIDPARASAPPVPGREVQAGRGGGRGGRGGGRGGGGAGGGSPSPDGRWLARAQDKPQPRPEPSSPSDFERRHLSGDRFKGVIFDWKDFQRDGAPFPAPDPTAQPAQQLVLQPASDGQPRVLVDMDLRPGGIAWHPDGQLLAFTADPERRNELKYSRTDLFTVTVDGTLTRLTDDGYVYSDVDFSPDGKYLSYSRSFGTDMIIDQELNHGGPRDIYVRPLPGGEPVNLTANWDLDPGGTRWSPDSRFLYFTAGIGGETHLFRVSVPGGQVEQVTKGPRRLNGITFDKALRKIAYTVGVHDVPPDVYVANIDGSNERRLTDVHKAIVSEIAFSRAERLRWPSYDGTEIEGWLLFPYGYDAQKGPYPMIVTSHGGPHSATGYSFDFKDQFFAANGYFVFDTNFRSSTGYGDAFKWATWGAWGDKDGQDVVSGIDYVLKHYPVDPGRVGHTGHSYGGFMTNWLITQYPDRFAAAITGAGISNWISDYGTADIYRTKETEFFGTPWEQKARDIMIRQSPLTYAGRVRTPTLFVHGEVDQRVPYEEAEQLYFALKRRGIPARMIQYAGQAHGISGHWNNVHRMISELQWWEKYLKPRAKSTSTAGRQ